MSDLEDAPHEPLTEEEREAAVETYIAEEVAGTSQILPGTTVNRKGEVNLGFTLKERLIDFYTVHRPSQQIDVLKLAATYEQDQASLNLELLTVRRGSVDATVRPRALLSSSAISSNFGGILMCTAEWQLHLENGVHYDPVGTSGRRGRGCYGSPQ